MYRYMRLLWSIGSRSAAMLPCLLQTLSECGWDPRRGSLKPTNQLWGRSGWSLQPPTKDELHPVVCCTTMVLSARWRRSHLIPQTQFPRRSPCDRGVHFHFHPWGYAPWLCGRPRVWPCVELSNVKNLMSASRCHAEHAIHACAGCTAMAAAVTTERQLWTKRDSTRLSHLLKGYVATKVSALWQILPDCYGKIGST